MIRKTGYHDTYEDDVKLPHRPLTQAEMLTLFSQIEEQVMDFYKDMDNDSFVALTEARKAWEATLLEMAVAEPETAKLWRETLLSSETGTEAQDAIVSAGLNQAYAPLYRSGLALREADNRHSWMKQEQAEAEKILAYLAGQRSGLRLGLQLALLVTQAESSGKEPGEKNQVPLRAAVAMSDDAEADRLIEALLGGQRLS